MSPFRFICCVYLYFVLLSELNKIGLLSQPYRPLGSRSALKGLSVLFVLATLLCTVLSSTSSFRIVLPNRACVCVVHLCHLGNCAVPLRYSFKFWLVVCLPRHLDNWQLTQSMCLCCLYLPTWKLTIKKICLCCLSLPPWQSTIDTMCLCCLSFPI